MKDDVTSRQAATDALESQERQRVAQKERYTFGNDGFSLENAYHDCKMVFDGITDDRSYQEADTGLILYYANEIIYALHKALKEVKKPNEDVPDINVGDMISRKSAINIVYFECGEWEGLANRIVKDINDMPSVQPDNSCDGCIYENADDGVLVPCGFCKRSHPDNYCERRTDG